MSEEDTHDHDTFNEPSRLSEGDHSGGRKTLSSKSHFSVSWDKYQIERDRKEAAKTKLMDLMLEMENVKLEAGYDSGRCKVGGRIQLG